MDYLEPGYYLHFKIASFSKNRIPKFSDTGAYSSMVLIIVPKMEHTVSIGVSNKAGARLYIQYLKLNI